MFHLIFNLKSHLLFNTEYSYIEIKHLNIFAIFTFNFPVLTKTESKMREIFNSSFAYLCSLIF